MKSYREELTFNIQTRCAYVNITPQVGTALADSSDKHMLVKIIGK